ncbi:hypothetical protein ILUMI_07520 [Ignelater luminosus]|uniref:Serpin domain-containing protein n=1 Tax=Ignelater luminosus TaxID=2038154 RepID=A0A8K0GG91_IGNLU|nr:hypothetical protein ILUMI_07520 [Ignelater luminosus]
MKCLLLLAFGLLSSTFAQESQILKEFSTGYNIFTTDVYKELLKYYPGNFIVCPLSADIVLALTNSGAQGETAKELSNALRLPEDPDKVREMFKAISPNLQSTNRNYTLSTANKIYVKKGFEIDDKFKNVAVDVFDAEIQNIDFTRNQEAAREINQWVEDKTHKKIHNLIRPDSLDEDTRTVLINAIYFHGKWVKEFKKHDTLKLPFYLNSKDHKETNMMLATNKYEYYESPELNAKFLKLDYEGGDVSMHIVLPNEKEGLAALEEKISDVLIPPEYGYEKVSVMIPKFKTETKIQFKPILQALGVKHAFKDDANFLGIGAHQEAIKISEVVQKAFIEVDEKGTTAAAATGVLQIVVTSLQPVKPPKLFHADHPFLFYLRLNTLGVNFFVGRYKSP